jgi:FkbM family methyltransferase
MLIEKLLRQNWQKQIIPPKWLRFLYRSKILNSSNTFSLPFEIDFYGMRYKGDITNSIDFHCYFYGAFEKGHLFFWNDVARAIYNNNGVYVDIGANQGHHSLFMSSRSKVVYSFEPYEKVRKKIVEKIQLNHINNIIIHDVGLGDKDEIMQFFAPNGSNLGLGSFVKNQKGRLETGIPVRIVAGDEYFNNTIPDEIHMIKIDVEAFEKTVIRGLNKTIEKYRPIIVVELEIGLDCSFHSDSELKAHFPSHYKFYIFDMWDNNGKKDKRKEGRFRKKGTYKLKALDFDLLKEQADIIAFPEERLQTFNDSFPAMFV